MERIVLATGNKGKIREFERAFSHMNITCVPVKEVATVPEPEETGTTFMENAILKAKYYSEKIGLPCLADDSGLTVDALEGEPGVYSARYAGSHGDDEANNQKLIRELQGKANRTAHYVCALALVYPDGSSLTSEASCDGEIQDTQMVLVMIHIFMYLNLEKRWRNSISIRRSPLAIVVKHYNNW